MFRLVPAILLRVCLVVALLAPGPAAAEGPFDARGTPADQIVLSWRPEPPARLFDSAMANRVLGVAAVLEATATRRLAVPSRRAEEVGWPQETEVLGYAHALIADAWHAYRVGVTPDGLVLFGRLGADQAGAETSAAAYAIPNEACGALLAPLLGYDGRVDADAGMPRGVVTPFPGLPRLSPILLDTPTIRERLNAGRPTELPETSRYLPDERFFVRLPGGYTPRRPAGLLVWVDAGPEGKPPGVFDSAADGMNLLMVGAANSGNARLSTDRYQLALDAVASAARRFHIDSGRVYVAGISGGGRVCSALAVCFPDIFKGAVPIVGLNCYEHVPLGDGRFVPLGFRKPDGKRWKLLREHRIGAVSGPLDFNYREMTNAVRVYQRDGLTARLFDYEDMAHTLPTAERFAEAIGWVDEPVAEARAAAAEDAGKQLDAYLASFDELPVTTEVQRRLLERITTTAPWSEPAWRACELLGIMEREAEPSTTGTP